MLKQDTPIRPPKAISLYLVPKPVANEDLMAALNSLKTDLKSDLAFVHTQMAELRVENSSLRSEIDILKGKLTNLDITTNTQQSPSVVFQVLQEAFERERCVSSI